MVYKFKGYDWTELADCWNITVEKQPINIKGLDNEPELKEMFKAKEKIDIIKFVNGMKMIFTVDKEEEVLAEKIKRHIKSNLDMSTGEFKDKQMRNDIDNFLKALIKESKRTDGNYPIYRGMLKVNDNHTLSKWICNNLEDLWT